MKENYNATAFSDIIYNCVMVKRAQTFGHIVYIQTHYKMVHEKNSKTPMESGVIALNPDKQEWLKIIFCEYYLRISSFSLLQALIETQAACLLIVMCRAPHRSRAATALWPPAWTAMAAQPWATWVARPASSTAQLPTLHMLVSVLYTLIFNMDRFRYTQSSV